MSTHAALLPRGVFATPLLELDLSPSEGDGHATLATHLMLPLAHVRPYRARRAADTCDGLRPVAHNSAGRADHGRTDACFANL